MSRIAILDAIILDGNQRSALAAVRSLGRRGKKVAVGEDVLSSLSSNSRYCSWSFSYPSPYSSPDIFIKRLEEVVSQNSGAILYPMTDVTLSEILKNRPLFSKHVEIPFVNYAKYNQVSDKAKLFNLAREISIPIPETLISSDFGNLEDIIRECCHVGFPLVVKPATSVIRTPQGWIKAGVRYASNLYDLHEILSDEPFQSNPFLVQKKVEGPGMGIFLLMQEGKLIVWFAHQRIREKPPSGGVSVLCKSIIPPLEAITAANKLLQELLWSGVAMVEFKWDNRDNLPKLMEVNARFWGSLQLAVSAGVDFPYFLYCMSTGEKLVHRTGYKINVKSRWELGDLDHLLLRLRKRPDELVLPPNTPSRVSAVKEFLLDFFRPAVRREIFSLEDPGPFFFEVVQYLRNIIH